MEEEWKLIKGYEDYEISSYGRIKYKGEFIEPKEETNHQYLYVILGGKHRKGKIRIHNLVARAFIPNPHPTEKVEVHHKDMNPKNNHVENLEWLTPEEHRQRHLKLFKESALNSNRGLKIVSIPLDYPEAIVHENQIQAAADVNATSGEISKALSPKEHRRVRQRNWFYFDDFKKMVIKFITDYPEEFNEVFMNE